MGKIDDIFLRFTYSKEGYKDVTIDISELGKEKAAKNLAEVILLNHKSDIKSYDKEDNPTLDLSRDIGFRLLLKFTSDGQDRFAITGCFGSSSYPECKVEYFHSDHHYSYEWYQSILKCLVNVLNPLYAGIYILAFSGWVRELKIDYPLGWISYYSDDYKMRLPDDLEGVEYEYTDKGKFLVTSREDFTSDRENFLSYKEKLLSIVKEVKRRVPEYTVEY